MKKTIFLGVLLISVLIFSCTKSDKNVNELTEKQVSSINKFNSILISNSANIGKFMSNKGLTKTNFNPIKTNSIANSKMNIKNLEKIQENHQSIIVKQSEPSNALTEAEAQALMQPIYISSIELLTDFEIYQDLVNEFQDPTISDIIMSAILVSNSASQQSNPGITEHEFRHCLMDALGIGGPSAGAIIWGSSAHTVKSLVLTASKYAGRLLGWIGITYSLWIFTDCLFEASGN